MNAQDTATRTPTTFRLKAKLDEPGAAMEDFGYVEILPDASDKDIAIAVLESLPLAEWGPDHAYACRIDWTGDTKRVSLPDLFLAYLEPEDAEQPVQPRVTPGDWFLSKSGRYVRYRLPGSTFLDEHYTICDLDMGCPPEEMKGNGQLIKSAKRLLKACKRMLATLDGPLGDYRAMLAAHREMDAAVQEAEGAS